MIHLLGDQAAVGVPQAPALRAGKMRWALWTSGSGALATLVRGDPAHGTDPHQTYFASTGKNFD